MNQKPKFDYDILYQIFSHFAIGQTKIYGLLEKKFLCKFT